MCSGCFNVRRSTSAFLPKNVSGPLRGCTTSNTEPKKKATIRQPFLFVCESVSATPRGLGDNRLLSIGDAINQISCECS